MSFEFRICFLVTFVSRVVISMIPPPACFAPFRWQDCGMPAKPVMYYWKPGSRCEVGFWKGCLPSPNMFKDEYECVATCIFAPRAKAIDWHNYDALDYDYDSEETTPAEVTETPIETAETETEVVTEAEEEKETTTPPPGP